MSKVVFAPGKVTSHVIVLVGLEFDVATYNSDVLVSTSDLLIYATRGITMFVIRIHLLLRLSQRDLRRSECVGRAVMLSYASELSPLRGMLLYTDVVHGHHTICTEISGAIYF